MSLPTLNSPKYTLQIPSTKKTVEYRPFLVKEEKILLIAQESENNVQIVNAMKDVIEACTFNKINANDLTSFDLEYVFIKLRAKSVGENSKISVLCKSCNHAHDHLVDLDSLEVNFEGVLPSRIMLTDTVGINMRYISVKDMTSLSAVQEKNNDLVTETIIASIDSIFDADKIYPTDESTREELETFINSLNRSQMSKIEKFISAIPKLQHTVKFKCSKCDVNNDITLSGAQSFF